MTATIDIFKALADEVRLRIVHAVYSAELSVQELVNVLGLPQSTVSRQLKPLRDAELLSSRREGTSVYYSRGAALAESSDLAQVLEARFEELPYASQDLGAVRRVLDERRKRSRDFFDKVAGQYSSLQQPGGGWDALASGMAIGFADKDIVDIGSGEGVLSFMIARVARRVVAVDSSSAMLEQVAARAKQEGMSDRIETVEGDLESIPLEDATFDACFLSQSLHHAARPSNAIKEATRLLRSGGWLIILDLERHENEWVREKWADQWLGFEEQELKGWMEKAGLESITYKRLDGAADEFSVLLAAGRKKA